MLSYEFLAIPENDDEDDDDDDEPTYGAARNIENLYLKPMKQKANAVFQSKVRIVKIFYINSLVRLSVRWED